MCNYFTYIYPLLRFKELSVLNYGPIRDKPKYSSQIYVCEEEFWIQESHKTIYPYPSPSLSHFFFLFLFLPLLLPLLLSLFALPIIRVDTCPRPCTVCHTVPSFAPSRFLALPQRSSMILRLSAAFLSCSFFSSSAAFLRSNNCRGEGEKGGAQSRWLRI